MNARSPGVYALNQESTVTYGKVDARSLLYEEIPDHYAWANKKWTRRTNNVPCASRLSHAGPREDLRTVNGVIYNTFREAANQRDLLESDKHYDYCLRDASFWMTGHRLRELFALILVHNLPADPAWLWERHKAGLTDDCLYRMQQNGYEGSIGEEDVFQYGLCLVKFEVEQMGGDWTSLELPIRNKSNLIPGDKLSYPEAVVVSTGQDKNCIVACNWDLKVTA
ncbi:hypothetical protein DFH28DRAFT_926604 [Melampsora americana]|nr:hypothetical protein DFH28DRAFT_926604 [Melampsora americana]